MPDNQYLPAGTESLTGWLEADGTAGNGPEDDGQYHIMSGSATITGATLNDLTSASGIGFLHTGKNYTGRIGTESVPFQPKYNATTSASKTRPGLVIGGACEVWFDPVTNACGRVRVYPGGTLHLVGSSGVITNLEVLPGGNVIRHTAGFDVQNVWCMGTYTDLIEATNDFDTFYAEGAAKVIARCQATAAWLYPISDGYGRLLGEPTVYVDHPDGWTSVTRYGGRIIPIRGAIPTIVDKGGSWDVTQVVNPMAIGATAYTRWPFASSIGVQAGSPVSITAPTDEMGGPLLATSSPNIGTP
jgi:hypothetical protein